MYPGKCIWLWHLRNWFNFVQTSAFCWGRRGCWLNNDVYLPTSKTQIGFVGLNINESKHKQTLYHSIRWPRSRYFAHFLSIVYWRICRATVKAELYTLIPSTMELWFNETGFLWNRRTLPKYLLCCENKSMWLLLRGQLDCTKQTHTRIRKLI